MFPRLWAAAGITYRELISRIVDLALARFGERRGRA
jgi:D-alanine-D-alanine ligase-like ATP-grasp enzyme